MTTILSRKPGGTGGGGGPPSGPAGGVLSGTYPNPSYSSSIPGAELAYAEFTANVSVTSADANNPTDVVSSGAVVYTAERICIEFFAVIIEPANADFLQCVLWDANTRLGAISEAALSGTRDVTVMARRFLTPTAASHTYRIRAYRGSGNGTIYAGSGASGQHMPGYIRVTRA